MKLTAEQVKNLNILADFMEGLIAPKFTMSRYVNYETANCNSPACALGWACTLPSLKAAGLNMKVLEYYDPGSPTDMAKNVFGNYGDLFDSHLKEKIRTPQQWAVHCRAFLKTNGYEVSDGFKTFMDRVLVPVDTKETTVAVK